MVGRRFFRCHRDVELISCCSPQGITMPLNPPPHTQSPKHTHKPLWCEFDSTFAANVRQAHYSYPEGALSVLTGRHKYSSTFSARVNGCPSDCGEAYRAACAWCTHTKYWHFQWNSKVTYRDTRKKGGRKRNHTRQPQGLCLSTFTWAQIYIYNPT